METKRPPHFPRVEIAGLPPCRVAGEEPRGLSLGEEPSGRKPGPGFARHRWREQGTTRGDVLVREVTGGAVRACFENSSRRGAGAVADASLRHAASPPLSPAGAPAPAREARPPTSTNGEGHA